MDSKSVRLAILLSVTAFALILLVVYATNQGRRRGGQTEPDTASSQEAGMAAEPDESYLHTIGESFYAYGDQIGSQPKGFMYDENFFDPMHDVGAGISDGDEEVLNMQATVSGDRIHISVMNSRGGLESGVAFQVSAEQIRGSRDRTWTDTDRDGQIDLTDLENGSYRLRLLQVRGYEVPATPIVVQIKEGRQRTDAGAGATGGREATSGSSTATGAPGWDPDDPANGSSASTAVTVEQMPEMGTTNPDMGTADN
ncbi:MAG: hypothetical protein IKO80_02150 [Lachnospiraceae bacterium]|nr:hypothetical protein [Lachnospiraceae bacterium]